MVFRGKSSRGCAACRRRKVRCDRRQGGCDNCRRLNKECPGYRNELDLLFLDETSDVLRKHCASSQHAWEEESSGFHTEARRTSSTCAVGEIATQFGYPSADEFALCYAYYWHVIQPMPYANVSTVVRDEKLLCVMKALGMASFSTAMSCTEGLNVARGYYGESIRSTNTALASPETCVLDSTLLAVIALSIYESIAGSTIRSVQAWSKHIEGTMALLELRGPEQMHTPAGRLLYMQAATSIIAYCFSRSIRVPDCLHSLGKEFEDNIEDASDPVWRDFSAKLCLADMKADVASGCPEGPMQIIQGALQIDEDYDQILTDLGEILIDDSQPRINKCDSASSDCSDYQKHMSSVSLRNSVYTGRLQCHLIILAALEQYPSYLSADAAQSQRHSSQQVIQEMQLAFLANLPLGGERRLQAEPQPVSQDIPTFLTNKIKVFPAVPMGYLRVANLALVDLPVVRTIRSQVVVRQLTFVGKLAEPGSGLRMAVCDALRTHGQAFGTLHAFRFANNLQSERMCLESERSWLRVLVDGRW